MSSPVRIAWSMASVHRTHASAQSSFAWVSDDIARAAETSGARSPRWASATGPVRINDPLPALVGLSACTSIAASVTDSPRSARARTVLVCTPMSEGELRIPLDESLAHLGRAPLVSAARAMSSLTHANELCADACVLWTLAIDHAIRTGELIGPRLGLDALPEGRREQWSALLDEAEKLPTQSFTPNGYVVTALQAAWSAIHSTRDDAAPSRRRSVERFR